MFCGLVIPVFVVKMQIIIILKVFDTLFTDWLEQFGLAVKKGGTSREAVRFFYLCKTGAPAFLGRG